MEPPAHILSPTILGKFIKKVRKKVWGKFRNIGGKCRKICGKFRGKVGENFGKFGGNSKNCRKIQEKFEKNSEKIQEEI